MSHKLGKKHFRYVPTGKRPFPDVRARRNQYQRNMLCAQTNLREILWDSNQQYKVTITPAKQKHYNKLERYYNRAAGWVCKKDPVNRDPGYKRTVVGKDDWDNIPPTKSTTFGRKESEMSIISAVTSASKMGQ